jgi:hypothetical protein
MSPAHKKYAVLLLIFLSILACNAPVAESSEAVSEPTATVETAPPTATIEPTPAPDVVYEGISFSYDETLAADVTAETIPAVVQEEGPFPETAPEHVEFSFVNYVHSGTFHEAYIRVWPTTEYQAVNEFAAERITALQQFLTDKPASPTEEIPFLPLWPAAQVFRAQVAYLDFQNGTGVRFLTMYSQAIVSINNHDIFYTFQGLTTDGTHYISVIMPVSHPDLPADDMEGVGEDFEAFANNYETYLQETIQNLDSQPPDSFSPSLTLLDEMIQSLLVE